MSSTAASQSQLSVVTFISPESIRQIEAVFPDILSWPASWMGDEDDLPAGHLVLGVFIQYPIDLMDKGRARSTVKKHGDYLWALGGEIIHDTNESGYNQHHNADELIVGMSIILVVPIGVMPVAMTTSGNMRVSAVAFIVSYKQPVQISGFG
jgi:hypothetical protein